MRVGDRSIQCEPLSAADTQDCQRRRTRRRDCVLYQRHNAGHLLRLPIRAASRPGTRSGWPAFELFEALALAQTQALGTAQGTGSHLMRDSMSEYSFETILAVVVTIVLFWIFWWRGKSN